MKRDVQGALILLALFFLLVVMLLTLDVKPIGPLQSSVGLSTINGALHKWIGTHPSWCIITDSLGCAAVLVALSFAFTGVFQLIKRRSLIRVDSSLLMLGLLYGLVGMVYLFFESMVINYRPLVLEGTLEASFPSSHTMLIICIMGSAAVECRHFVPGKRPRIILQSICILVMLITVSGRLYSGVHWFTDVLGAVLLGSSLVLLFKAAVSKWGGK